jgi:methylated-DNA-[protein]-cysteine S-methyltransferase
MKTAVCFARTPSPLGTMLLVAVDDALAGIHFDGQRDLPAIDAEWRYDAAHPALRAASLQLGEYFTGKRTVFHLPLAAVGTPFQRAVWAAIRTVRYGETITYTGLAARAGAPRSIRAAGAATGRNPWGIVVPCHRIVGADGSLTGYAGGLPRKRALLDLESARAALAHAA